MSVFKSNFVQRALGFVVKHLGEIAEFKSCKAGSVWHDVKLVFDNRAELIDPDTETVISSNQPLVFVNLSNFSDGIKQGDRFRFSNKTYKVWTVQEDGQGGAKVFLHKIER